MKILETDGVKLQRGGEGYYLTVVIENFEVVALRSSASQTSMLMEKILNLMATTVADEVLNTERVSIIAAIDRQEVARRAVASVVTRIENKLHAAFVDAEKHDAQ